MPRRPRRSARWPGWCWVLLGHAGLLQATVLLLRMTTAYRAVELGVPVGWLGAVAACFAVAPLLVGYWIGHLVERYGERGTVRLGAVTVGLAAAGLWLGGGSLAALLVCTCVLGLGQVLAIVGEQSMVATRIPRPDRPALFGWYGVAVSLGQVVGPLLAGQLGGTGTIPDTRTLFAAGTALAVLVTAVSLALSPPAHRVAARAAGSAATTLRQTLRTPGVRPAIITGLMVVAATDLLVIYLPAFGAERGIDADLVGLLLAVRAAAAIASRIWFSRLLRWLGRRRLLVSALAAAAVGFAVTPLGLPLPGLAAAMVVAGSGLGIGLPLTLAWVTDAVPTGQRARALSLRLMGTRVGQSLVPLLVGLVAAATGSAGVLWATATGLGMVAAGNLRTGDQGPDG